MQRRTSSKLVFDVFCFRGRSRMFFVFRQGGIECLCLEGGVELRFCCFRGVVSNGFCVKSVVWNGFCL